MSQEDQIKKLRRKGKHTKSYWNSWSVSQFYGILTLDGLFNADVIWEPIPDSEMKHLLKNKSNPAPQKSDTATEKNYLKILAKKEI